MPLLELIVHGAKQKEERELGNRATNLFHLLYKRAEVRSCDRYVVVYFICSRVLTQNI